jgi:hypothetical protein
MKKLVRKTIEPLSREQAGTAIFTVRRVQYPFRLHISLKGFREWHNCFALEVYAFREYRKREEGRGRRRGNTSLSASRELREKLLSRTDFEAIATDTQETFVSSSRKIEIGMRSNLHKNSYRKSCLSM